MRISDWSADVCSSDLHGLSPRGAGNAGLAPFLKTAQSLLQEIRHLAQPVPSDLRPPGDGVEDEGTTAPQAAKKLMESLWRLRLVLGVELIVAAQAIELRGARSEEHTSELQSLMRISYAVFCLKKQNKQKQQNAS